MGKTKLMLDLYMCPIYFSEEVEKFDPNQHLEQKRDNKLYFSDSAASMFNDGARIAITDNFPTDLVPAEESIEDIRLGLLTNGENNNSYVPLFVSYDLLIKYFGEGVHIGVISLSDAMDFLDNSSELNGILLGPGNINQLIVEKNKNTC